MVAAETPVLLLISLTETFLSCTKYAMFARFSALKARVKTMVSQNIQERSRLTIWIQCNVQKTFLVINFCAVTNFSLIV